MSKSLDSDVSTQCWALISEKSCYRTGRRFYTHEWQELVTGGEVRKGIIVIVVIIILE